MKCVVCHGEDIQIATVEEVLKTENDLVYVTIRIPVCLTCGERYYDRRTMRYLENVSRKLREDKEMNLQEVGRILLYA